jgi:nuclear pore complex protein Nup160
MCEANQVGQLLKFGFVGFQKDIEATLSFKARYSDPLKPPHYHQVLYSWHVTRGDYRSGKLKDVRVTRLTRSGGRDVSASEAFGDVPEERRVHAIRCDGQAGF